MAVRIPKEVALGFRSGTAVELRREGDTLLVTAAEKKQFTLKKLVAGINTKNLHRATDWGKPQGKEIW